MPRKKRLSVPGAIHHVMAHSIAGKNLFCHNDDRRHFLKLFEKGIIKTGFVCYAWSLMDTHYHLLLRPTEEPLATLMRNLNGMYARYYGKKYSHKGYVFQGRFKSIATQDQGYIEELVRYIHLNPVRAGICKTLAQLDTYAWSGHAAMLGMQSNAFQDVRTVLRKFARNVDTARKKYREFIRQGLEIQDDDDFIEHLRQSNKESENIHDYGCWVIGDREFVKKALAADRQKRLRIADYRKKGFNLDLLKELVAKAFKIPPQQLFRRGHANTSAVARRVFAYAGSKILDYSVSEIARYLNISSPAVSKSLDKGRAEAQEIGIAVLINKVN